MAALPSGTPREDAGCAAGRNRSFGEVLAQHLVHVLEVWAAIGTEEFSREGAVVSSQSRKVFPSFSLLPVCVEECSMRLADRPTAGSGSRPNGIGIWDRTSISPRTVRIQLRRHEG